MSDEQMKFTPQAPVINELFKPSTGVTFTQGKFLI